MKKTVGVMSLYISYSQWCSSNRKVSQFYTNSAHLVTNSI